MDAIKAYIETALRIATETHAKTIDVKTQEHLSAIIVGLKIALDQFINEY